MWLLLAFAIGGTVGLLAGEGQSGERSEVHLAEANFSFVCTDDDCELVPDKPCDESTVGALLASDGDYYTGDPVWVCAKTGWVHIKGASH